MQRRPPVALAGLLLLAAVAGRAAETQPSGGTLDQSRTELQQLQKDQKTKAGQESNKLKLDGPAVDLQKAPDAGSPESWLANQLKKDRKLKDEKDARKNWLVDGVEKLERADAQSKDPNAVGAKDGSDRSTGQVDPSDPQYLLKLFDEQKKSSDSKSAAGRSPAAASPDPFAPFLQNWLGSSPVKSQLLDQFARKTDGGSLPGAPAVAGDYRGGGGSSDVPVVVSHDAAAATKANPYLADMNGAILAREAVPEAPPLSSMGAPAMTSDPAKTGPVLLPPAPGADNRERQKGPPPSPLDDKKYFPQLKRF
jgi:hypothetical protein